MHGFWFQVAFLVSLAAFAVALYFGYGYLPASWRDKLVGIKAKILASLAIALPELLNVLLTLQSLQDYTPPGWDWAKPAFQIIGVLILVCRWWTDKEQKAA